MKLPEEIAVEVAKYGIPLAIVEIIIRVCWKITKSGRDILNEFDLK